MSNKSVLKNKHFKNLWLGQAISQFGDACYYWVFLYVIDRLTESPTIVGLMGAVETLPFLIFAPLAGVVADRFDRRKILLAADLASACLLTILGLTLLVKPVIPLWSIFLIAFSLSTINAFFNPAKGAAIPALVPKEDIISANALSSMTQGMMPLLGVALSGTVLALIDKCFPNYFFSGAVFINAMTFALSAHFIAKLPKLIPEKKLEQGVKVVKEYWEGLKYIKSHTALKLLLIAEFWAYLFIAPFLTTYVTTNRLWFGGQFNTLALIEFCCGVAMIIGSLLVSKQKITKVAKPYIIARLFISLWVSLLIFGQSLPLYILFNFIACLAVPYIHVIPPSYVQASVPDAYQGRVNSILNMITMGTLPLGMGLAGTLIEHLGLANMYLLMGLGLATSILIGIFNPQFRAARIAHKKEVDIKENIHSDLVIDANSVSIQAK